MDKWNLLIDVAKCENCHNCTLAAKDEFEGNAFPGYARPLPRHGQNLITISRHIRGAAPMVDVTYLPTLCNHCDDAPCVAAGGGCVTKRPDGIVLIDPDASRGRRDLVDACPYGAISWNEAEQVPQHWFFDAHLLDQGWSEPRCSHVCPTGAMETIKTSDARMAELARERDLEVLRPELGTRPRVYYANLHRLSRFFIGGEVVMRRDGRLDCVEGAKVTLSRDGTILSEMHSDVFGNFKFDGLDRSDGYTIEITFKNISFKKNCLLKDDSLYYECIELT